VPHGGKIATAKAQAGKSVSRQWHTQEDREEKEKREKGLKGAKGCRVFKHIAFSWRLSSLAPPSAFLSVFFQCRRSTAACHKFRYAPFLTIGS